MDEIISVQVVNMITQQQIQLLRTMMRTLWTLVIKWVGTANFRRSIVARLKPPWNLSATGVRLVADQSPINRGTVADQSRNSRRLIADRSQKGCQISKPKCWWNPSATDRWLVGVWSATSRKPLQPVCDQNQSRLVFCACSKDWLRLNLFGDLSATSMRPL